MNDYTSIVIYYEDKENNVVSKHYDNIPLEKVKEIMEQLNKLKGGE